MSRAVTKPKPAPTPTWYTVLWGAIGVAAVVAVGGFWIAGEVLESVTDRDGIAMWDRPILDWMLAARTPTTDGVIAWYSNAGGPLWQPIITGLVVAFLCWRYRSVRPLILTVIAAGGALAMTILGKRAVGRVRPPFEESIPPHELSASFPSGHSLNAIVIAGILCYLILIHLEERRPLASALWILFFSVYAVTMGLSRVYLGHHWLTDVLAAWVLGLAWLALVIGVHRLWHAMRPQPDKGPAG
ncbi:phosphatase PAP2 family protein [Tessaracoccus sp. Y1736]